MQTVRRLPRGPQRPVQGSDSKLSEQAMKKTSRPIRCTLQKHCMYPSSKTIYRYTKLRLGRDADSMLSENKNNLLDAVYRYGGYVTVPAIMAWKHITDTGARKSINALCSLGYLEEVPFSDNKTYPTIFRITGAGVFYLRQHSVRETDNIYGYSILYKVLRSHALFQLAGQNVIGILTENAEKIRFLKNAGFSAGAFDRHTAGGRVVPIFRDCIIPHGQGFTSLYVDKGYENVRNILETRLSHLQKFLKERKFLTEQVTEINLMICTDREDRKDAFLWAYDAEYSFVLPHKFDCRLLNYCYTRV